MTLLLTLRGTPFMYYGEEIGMRDIHLRHSEILDPAGKKYWPLYKGRDGCRSPMQWDQLDLCRIFDCQTLAAGTPELSPAQCRFPASGPGFSFQLHQKASGLAQENPRPARRRLHPARKSARRVILYAENRGTIRDGGSKFQRTKCKIHPNRWRLANFIDDRQRVARCACP